MLNIPEARKKKKNLFNKKNFTSNPLTKNQLGLVTHLYKGLFKYGYVIIENDDAQALWENGFYGDGSISASGMKCIGHQKTKEKDNLSPIKEVLHLCHEEALFLSYAFGSLILIDEEKREMSIDEMWTAFTEINPQFPVQYAVYHHMKCKGWVVKPGIKFGADWALYPVGPLFYHSQFLVWIQCLWEDDLEEDFTLSNRQSDITSISAIERLSSHVSKSVLLCQVLRPRDLSDENLKSIDCLKCFTIKEVILQHWTTKSDNSKSDTANLKSNTTNSKSNLTSKSKATNSKSKATNSKSNACSER